MEHLQNFSAFRRNGFLCDAIVVANDKTVFKVHRLILAAASKYFEGKFDWRESCQDFAVVRVNLGGKSLGDVLDWIYEQKISFRDTTHACEVLIGSQLLTCQALTDECMRRIEGDLEVGNVFLLWEFGRTHLLPQVQKSCLEYVARNFPEVLKKQAPDLLTLPDNEFVSLLTLDSLMISYEDDVLALVRKKLAHSEDLSVEERLKCLSTVRFPLLLLPQLSPEESLARFFSSQDRLRRSCSIQDPPNERPRLPQSVVYLLEKNYSRKHKKLVIYGLDSRAHIIRRIHESIWHENLPRIHATTLFMEKEIILLQNKPASTFEDEWHVFGINITTWKLRRFPPLPRELNHLNDGMQLIALTNTIYVLHIQMSTLPESVHLYRYTEAENGWETQRPWNANDHMHLIDPRFISLEGRVILMDGLSIVGMPTRVFALNEVSKSFERLQDIPDVQRFYPKTCEWNNRLLIYGGFPPFPAVHKYLNTFLEWRLNGSVVDESTIPPTNQTMRHFRIVPCDTGLLAFQSNWKVFECEYYDPKAKLWNVLKVKLDSNYNLVDMMGAVTISADKVQGFSRKPLHLYKISNPKLRKALHVLNGSLWTIVGMTSAYSFSKIV